LIDLEVLAWLIVLGIPILLWLGYWSIGFLSPILDWLKPKPKEQAQRTLCEFMHDRFPYLKRWVSLEEDSEYSELEGYESSSVMDNEDEE